MDNAEFTKLKALMTAIETVGGHWVRNEGAYRGILSKKPYKKLTREVKDLLQEGQDGDFGDGKIILPTPKDLPKTSHVLLSCAWQFTKPEDKFLLRYGFLTKSKDISQPDSKNTVQYHFSGFRYETPHGPGQHNYYHAQPIIHFKKNDNNDYNPDVMTTDWLPSKLPAFPLRAESPFELLVCSLRSIYGADELTIIENRIKAPQAKQAFRAYLNKFE